MSAEDASMSDIGADHSQSHSQQEQDEPRNVPPSVTVYLVGQDPKLIRLDAMQSFGDIMAALAEQGVEMDNRVLVDDQDNVKSAELPLQNNVPEAGLAVKVQIPLYVIHDNAEWTVLILLNSKMTIQTVKNNLLSQEGGQCFANVALTWRGRVVGDELRTDQLEGIHLLASFSELTEDQVADFRLIGRKVISIMDIDLGEVSIVELKEVTDDMSIKDVLQLYQGRERRGYLHMPLLSKYIEGETNAESIQVQPNISLEETVYQAHIDNGDVLALKTGMFEVVLKESSEIEAVTQKNKGVGLSQQRNAVQEVPGVRVMIFDWWKVKQLKDAYSALVTDGLSANDQIFLDSSGTASSSSISFNDELSEEKTLYHYQVRETSVLLVKREDFTTTHCYYICADCGNDVKLKQKDHVRCRECGHRIVFKRRIAKPCQYLCR